MRKSWLSFGSGDSYKKSRNVEIAPTTSFSKKSHIVTRTDGRFYIVRTYAFHRTRAFSPSPQPSPSGRGGSVAEGEGVSKLAIAA